ncbi:unnamed protein product, partial [Prorocentrum cordatum]
MTTTTTTLLLHERRSASKAGAGAARGPPPLRPPLAMGHGTRMRRSSVDAAAGAAARGLAPPGRRSPFESSLAVGARWAAPRLCGLDAVRRALEGDVLAQQRKYAGLEPQLQTARFHVALPRSPQHSKFSWRARRGSAPQGASRVAPLRSGDDSTATPDSAVSDTVEIHRSATGSCSAFLKAARLGQHAVAPKEEASPTARTSKLTLLQMFRDIDCTGCGVVTQRQLVVALQKRPEYASAFFQRSGGSPQREGAQRIREILDQAAATGASTGTRSWTSFGGPGCSCSTTRTGPRSRGVPRKRGSASAPGPAG